MSYKPLAIASAPASYLEPGTAGEMRLCPDGVYVCNPQRTTPSSWVIGTGSPANLVTNGEFETDTAGWAGDATLSRETVSPLVGTGSLKALLTANGAWDAYYYFSGLIVGHQYFAVCRVKSTAAAEFQNLMSLPDI